MATHQEIAGVSDKDLVERMIRTHDARFDENFWAYFEQHLKTGLENKSIVADVGCGPGLLLRDISQRYANTELYGFDVTSAMLDYAEAELDYPAEKPTYQLHDITTEALPFETGSVDLLIMVAVLHVLPVPLPVLAEVKRVLKPGGKFLLQDWIANPLPDYLARMLADVPADKQDKARDQMFKLFPAHNKYTRDDWAWLLDQGGFKISAEKQLQSPHFRTFVCELC